MDLLKEINLKPKNFRAFKIGAVLFLAFIVMLLAEVWGVFSSFDPSVTQFLQAGAPRVIDVPLSVFSLLGSFELISLVLIILAIIIFRKKKIIYYPLILFGVILGFEFIGKLFLYHPTPPAMYFRYELPFYFPSSYVQTKSSFPSGHVARTLFLAVVASALGFKLLSNKKLAKALVWFWVIFSVVMVISRIYLGEHWASDTIGGMLLGGAMGFFALIYI